MSVKPRAAVPEHQPSQSSFPKSGAGRAGTRKHDCVRACVRAAAKRLISVLTDGNCDVHAPHCFCIKDDGRFA
jgi:hypothetical protein